MRPQPVSMGPQRLLGEFGGSNASYAVTLGLFLMTVPGVYSLVKRAPKATVKRITYEIPGPSAPEGREMDAVARDVAAYFRKYNYRITAEGATVAFTGAYEASRGTAAATTFYFFIGLACIALVLQTIVPRVGPFEIGNGWYALTLLSPLAWTYYFRQGDREETVKMRMECSDDSSLIDLIVEGDKEELERMERELQLMQKGKVYVKGLFEQS